MACLIAEVSTKHGPETIGGIGITESVRQVVTNQTTKAQFTEWCWNMIALLKLHCMDRGKEIIRRTLTNPQEIINFIPELKRTDAIFQGLTEQRPIALYLSILTTQYGHSVPEICHNGFTQIQLLINDNRFYAVIRCIQLISPMFLECPDSLCKFDKFQLILSQILSADRGYLKSINSPGPILEMFGNMLQSQIIDYVSYGLSTPTPFIYLWLQCLTQNQNWIKDWKNMYVIELIVKIAYQFPDGWRCAKEYFHSLYSLEDVKKDKTSSFMNFLGSSSQSSVIPQSNAYAVWLSFLTLELEHEIFEKRTKLWPELLRTMNQTSGKVSIENSIKKSASSVGCSAIPAGSLVVYKLAYLLLMTPIEHELLPIIAQSFFTLYLARIPLSLDEERHFITYGVADKFYEGNIGIMKKLKRILIKAENYYKSESLKETDEIISQIFSRRTKLFNTFILWLEETQINKMNCGNIDLPPQYDVQRLKIIFQGNSDHWTELLHLPTIRKTQKWNATKWLTQCFRNSSSNYNFNNSIRPIVVVEPKQRIFNRLKTYDAPIPPMNVQRDSPILKPLFSDFGEKILPKLRNDFSVLEKYSKQFDLSVKDFSSINHVLIDLLRKLYSNVNIEVKRSLTCGRECSRAAVLYFQVNVIFDLSDKFLRIFFF